ncbi:MAG: hypothetical protein IID46_12800, partial [Planctomycetes bacterium]|nr:hypothetical protein [Planctomycetota bacterium]
KQALSDEELLQVADEINARIAEGAAVSTQVMDLDDAKKLGAMALFGEKYPDRVRVVSMGDFSTEFCGGTHLTNTGQVGFCKIISEEPVAKGVRRITAFTGPRALGKIRDTENLLKKLVQLLKTPQPEDLPRRVTVLQEELHETKQALAKQMSQSVSGVVDELYAAAEQVAGVKIITHLVPDGTREMLRDFADQLRSKGHVLVWLGSEIDGKVALTTAVSKDLARSENNKRGIDASEIVKTTSKLVDGGGGGRPDLAEAGGKTPSNLQKAREAAKACFAFDQWLYDLLAMRAEHIDPHEPDTPFPEIEKVDPVNAVTVFLKEHSKFESQGELLQIHAKNSSIARAYENTFWMDKNKWNQKVNS